MIHTISNNLKNKQMHQVLKKIMSSLTMSILSESVSFNFLFDRMSTFYKYSNITLLIKAYTNKIIHVDTLGNEMKEISLRLNVIYHMVTNYLFRYDNHIKHNYRICI